jgi:hypothetical protein
LPQNGADRKLDWEKEEEKSQKIFWTVDVPQREKKTSENHVPRIVVARPAVIKVAIAAAHRCALCDTGARVANIAAPVVATA